MRRIGLAAIVAIVLAAAWPGAAAVRGDLPQVRFETLEVVIDPAGRPLATYQLEITATSGNVRIVGIEGGAHPVFTEPPYYDPAAIQNQRVILAAFSSAAAETLPVTPTRVATIHLAVDGPREPVFAAKLTVAGTVDGEAIPARLLLGASES